MLAAPRLFAVTADGARGGFSVAPLKRGTVDAEDCASAVAPFHVVVQRARVF
jgi:hypothetical protein